MIEPITDKFQSHPAFRIDRIKATRKVPQRSTGRRPDTSIISRATQRKYEMRTLLDRALQRWRTPC